MLIIESFEFFSNNIYNINSAYNISASKRWLITVLIKVFKTISTIFLLCISTKYIQIWLLNWQIIKNSVATLAMVRKS